MAEMRAAVTPWPLTSAIIMAVQPSGRGRMA